MKDLPTMSANRSDKPGRKSVAVRRRRSGVITLCRHETQLHLASIPLAVGPYRDNAKDQRQEDVTRQPSRGFGGEKSAEEAKLDTQWP